MMQFRRWMITNSMMVRRIGNAAMPDFKAKNYGSDNMFKLYRLVYVTGLMTWMAFSLGKAGYEEAKKIAKSGAELLYTIFDMFPPKFIYDAIAGNPTIDTLASFVYTYEELLYYIGVGEKPYKIEIKKGIDELYFRALNLLGNKKKTKKDNSGINMPSINIPGIELKGIELPGIEL
jgi:hypothetical protein